MVEIDFKGVGHSDALETTIQTRAADLKRIYPEMMSCHVVLDAPHRSQSKGNIFQVHIHLKIPGDNVDVTREAGVDHTHKDMYIAISDAFDTARRLLTKSNSKFHDRMTSRETIRKPEA